MRSRWGDVLGIRLAEAPDTPHGVEALLERSEPTISAATHAAAAVLGAPWIILGLGVSARDHSGGANSEGE